MLALLTVLDLKLRLSKSNMSQALLAYTLPNGTKVFIPLDNKRSEYLPLVLFGDRSPDPVDSNSTTNLILSGMQVSCDDIDSIINTVCSSEAAEIEEHFEPNNFEHSFPSALKCVDKQNVFGSAIIVNSELSEFVEMQRIGNDSKDCIVDDKSVKDVKASKSDGHLRNVQEDRFVDTKTLANDSCDPIGSGVEALQNLLETCGTVGITVKDATNSSAQVRLEVVGCENDSCGNNTVKNGISLKTNLKEINGETERNQMNVSEYMDIKNRNATEGLMQLTDSIGSPTNIVLGEVCENVALCSNSEGLENGEVSGCSNNIILDHLDEFAEMVTWFKCRLCKFAAGNKEVLLDHLQTEHLEGSCDSDLSKLEDSVNRQSSRNGDNVSEKLVFLCGQCSAGFNSINACKTHMMQVHELVVQENDGELSNNTILENSDVESSNRIDQVHVSSVNPDDFCISQAKYSTISAPFKCSVRGCQSKFTEARDLQIHITCHTDTENCRDFRCCECQTPFERWRSCAMHLWKVHNTDCGLLTCPICLKYKTATSVPLENHMRIHREVRSFTCLECGKGFKQAAQLHNHRVMHLDRKTSELPRWYASKQCNICFKNYANSKCLKKHIQAVHSKLRPYVCQVCGHASARKAMLQLHYRQHTGEKPHNCPLCDYRTGDHNSLRRHIMRHTGQRPYRCPHCPYSAIQSNSYKNHLRNKHPGQSGVFSCGQCSFKTVSHDGFLLHVSDHKNGLISCSSGNDGESSDVEVFPGNVAAAQLIYRCLNALSDGGTVEANVTGSSTSADGTMQTITIQIPNQECSSENEDEVSRCFRGVQQQLEEDSVGTSSDTASTVLEQNPFCQIVA